MYVKGMYLSLFYWLCYVKYMSTYLLGEHVSEERDPNSNNEEDIIMDETRDNHWRVVSEEDDDKKKIHALRWEVYVKNKDKLIKREFPVYITHPTGGGHCLD